MVIFDILGYCFRPRSVRVPYSQKKSPQVHSSGQQVSAERDTGNDPGRRSIDAGRHSHELNPIVWGWITYYGQYVRSALYPMARYIKQTIAIWLKRKYQRFLPTVGGAPSSWRRSLARTADSLLTGNPVSATSLPDVNRVR